MGILHDFFQAMAGAKSSHKDPYKQPEGLAEIERVLSSLNNPRQAQLLAGLALLLGQVAYADMHVSEAERQKMLDLLQDNFNLPIDIATAVSELALDQAAINSFDKPQVWQSINTIASSAEKKQIIELLFALAAEDYVSSEENEEIRIVAKALQISHEEFITLRLKFREKMGYNQN